MCLTLARKNMERVSNANLILAEANKELRARQAQNGDSNLLGKRNGAMEEESDDESDASSDESNIMTGTISKKLKTGKNADKDVTILA